MRDVCDRSFGVLGLTEPHTCETGAKFACCPSSTARSVNIPSLGRCTKGRGDDLEDEKEIDAHEEITNESIDELEDDEFDEMDESDFSEDVMGQEDKNNNKKRHGPKQLEGQRKPRGCIGRIANKVCCYKNNDRFSWWQCGGTKCSSEDEKKMGTVVRVA